MHLNCQPVKEDSILANFWILFACATTCLRNNDRDNLAFVAELARVRFARVKQAEVRRFRLQTC
jgi:hypothetical protein